MSAYGIADYCVRSPAAFPRPPRGTEVIAVNAGGVKAERIATPRSLHNRYLLHFHGGAYLFGFPALFRDFTWRIADAASAQVLCIDYRLAPEHPFPAAIEDAMAAYRGLIAECAEPRHVAFIGDSSGGGLVLASMMRLRDEGSPLPAAAVVLSPWTDLALTGQSRLISPAPIRARLTPLRSTAIRQACRRRSFMSAVMRHCAMMQCAWPSACNRPAARWNSKCGRTCFMSGLCSRASCQKRAQRSRALVRFCKPGCHDQAARSGTETPSEAEHIRNCSPSDAVF